MDDGYVCCFTGHRYIDAVDAQRLSEVFDSAIEKLIESGVRVFCAGGALGFDTFAALAIIDKRKTRPFLRLHLYLPCKEQAEKWSERDKRIYSYILKEADEITYTSENYTKGCMLHRNRCLVDNADFCLAYCKKTTGGTAYTLNYAKKKSIRTLNIARMLEKA